MILGLRIGVLSSCFRSEILSLSVHMPPSINTTIITTAISVKPVPMTVTVHVYVIHCIIVTFQAVRTSSISTSYSSSRRSSMGNVRRRRTRQMLVRAKMLSTNMKMWMM